MNNKISKFEFSGKKLKISSNNSENELEFPYPIDMISQFQDKLVVLLLMDDITFNENVFGVSSEGRILWQIKPVKYVNRFSPYSNLVSVGDMVEVFNVDGCSYILDPTNGMVVSEKFRK